jgi:hypothetical protein
MRKRLIETQIESAVVNAARNSTATDIGAGETVAFVCTASASSSPVGTTITLQGSLDNTNFVNIGSAVSVTGDGSFAVSEANPCYRYYRVAYARSSGSYTSTLRILVKGDSL